MVVSSVFPDHLPSLEAPPKYSKHEATVGYVANYAIAGSTEGITFQLSLHDEAHPGKGPIVFSMTRSKHQGTLESFLDDSADGFKPELPSLFTMTSRHVDATGAPRSNKSDVIARADVPTAYDLWENTSQVGPSGGTVVLHYAADEHKPDGPWEAVHVKIDKVHARFSLQPPTAPSSKCHFDSTLKDAHVYWQVVQSTASGESAKQAAPEEPLHERSTHEDWFWLVLKLVPNHGPSSVEKILAYAKVRLTHTQEVYVDLFDPPLAHESGKKHHAAAGQQPAAAAADTEGLVSNEKSPIPEHVVIATGWIVTNLVRERAGMMGAVPKDKAGCSIM